MQALFEKMRTAENILILNQQTVSGYGKSG
jgi:hypothetical protein